jgi:hypothetical protein
MKGKPSFAWQRLIQISPKSQRPTANMKVNKATEQEITVVNSRRAPKKLPKQVTLFAKDLLAAASASVIWTAIQCSSTLLRLFTRRCVWRSLHRTSWRRTGFSAHCSLWRYFCLRVRVRRHQHSSASESSQSPEQPYLTWGPGGVRELG